MLRRIRQTPSRRIRILCMINLHRGARIAVSFMCSPDVTVGCHVELTDIIVLVGCHVDDEGEDVPRVGGRLGKRAEAGEVCAW